MKTPILNTTSMMKLTFILNLFFFTASIFAQNSAVNTKNNIAIQGYDPVAYFTENKATVGKKEINSKVEGATYYFSSKKNKALFDKNPANYMPQYGGYCAYGVSQGYKAPIKPESFTIFNGKLYLNYNLEVRDTWSKNLEERVSNGDKNWIKIISK